MITIFYGDDTKLSREKFIAARSTARSPISLNPEEITLTHLKQLCEGGMLFVDSKEIFIEHFISKAKKGKENELVIAYLNEQGKNQNVFIYENKDLTKTQTNSFPKAVLIQSKLPKALFAFLDAFMPNNTTYLIKLLHKTLETSDIEIVFSMLCRQVRLLIALQTGSDAIEETKKLAPWQKGKLQSQAKSFSESELQQIHASLFALDYKRKVGSLPASFPVCIDFFLLGIYH